MEDIIYLEADSEITEAIDKLKSAKGRAVKLVVPARSGLLQSVVNLKLLKKAAEDSSKQLALVTNDKTAKFLAARIGLAVASNIKAEPKVPDLPAEAAASEPDIDEAKEAAAAAAATKAADAAEANAAGDEAIKATSKSAPAIATRSLDDEEPDDNVGDKAAAKPAKKAQDKSTKIPDFNRFQKRLLIIGAAAVGLILLILLLNFVPGAKIVLSTQADKKAVDIKFTADTKQTQPDPTGGIVTAKTLSEGKDLNTSFAATGKKNVGTKATGNIAVKNCDNANPQSVPAGTTVSSSGLNFTTNSAVTVPGGSTGGGKVNCSSPVTVGITAAQNGDNYNLANATFAIAGMPALVNGSGTTSGGSTKVVTVVAQSDIDTAKKQLLDGNAATAKQDLQSKAGDKSTAFADTFAANVTSFNSSAAADTEASNATVTMHVDYTMLAASNDALDQLFNTQIQKDLNLDTDIYQNGRDSATFKVLKANGADSAQIEATGTAYVGGKIDKALLAKKLAGKTKKSAEATVKSQYPQVQSVQVNSLPFWPWLPVPASHNHIQIQVITQ